MLQNLFLTLCFLVISDEIAINWVSASTMRPRIVNGTTVTSSEFKYFVQILKYDKAGDKWSLCGGAIYKPTIVLTAAQCISMDSKMINDPDFMDEATQNTYVRPNSDNTISPDTSSSSRVKMIEIHPHYNVTLVKMADGKANHYMANDICLLHLSEPLRIDDRTRMISLPDKQYGPGTKLSFVGFGATLDRHVSEKLQQARVSIVQSDLCTDTKSFYDSSQYLCIKPEKDQDYGSGDSGGPLAFNKNGQHILVGLSSHIVDNQRCKSCHIDTNVFNYVNWIKEKI